MFPIGPTNYTTKSSKGQDTVGFHGMDFKQFLKKSSNSSYTAPNLQETTTYPVPTEVREHPQRLGKGTKVLLPFLTLSE